MVPDIPAGKGWMLFTASALSWRRPNSSMIEASSRSVRCQTSGLPSPTASKSAWVMAMISVRVAAGA
jgi:hypothetical protein